MVNFQVLKRGATVRFIIQSQLQSRLLALLDFCQKDEDSQNISQDNPWFVH